MKFKEKIKSWIKKKLGIIEPQTHTLDDYRKTGVTIGEGTKIYGANIDSGHGYLITIGKNCIISTCTILAHDGSTYMALGYSRVGKVTIGDEVFIGLGTVVLPNVNIGNKVIIGANAVVTKDIPDNSVAVGNPAKVIGTYDDYIAKNRKLLETNPRYETYHAYKSEEEKADMVAKINGIIGFDK